MLMVPASNWSVPLTVVMRTRSRVEERVLSPPPKLVFKVVLFIVCPLTQVLDPNDCSVMTPLAIAVVRPESIINPAVLLPLEIVFPDPAAYVLAYPVSSMPPASPI